MDPRPEQIEATAAAWLARRDSADWVEEDEQALADWLGRDTRHRVAYLRLRATWDEAGRLEALGAGRHEAGPPPRGLWPAAVGDTATRPPHAPPPRFDGVVFAPRAPRRRSVLPRVAAGALMVGALALGWAWYSFAPLETAAHQTALGELGTVPLADGTRATLASDSRIEVRLTRRERRVTLRRGEAYFDAARDPGRPLVIAAGERRVVAVGTRFSVRRDGPDLRVVVTEGSVRLESDPVDGKARPAALLPAGSVALARRDGTLVRSMPLADAAQLVDWRSGLLVFRDTTLAEAADEFNRYNRRKIVIVDDEIAGLRIGGSFRWANAEGFVRLLEQGFPVRADYGAERIVLRSP